MKKLYEVTRFLIFLDTADGLVGMLSPAGSSFIHRSNGMRTSSERRHLNEVAVQRQLGIGLSMGFLHEKDERVKQPHRLAKYHAANCGVVGCKMCGNPRRQSSKASEKLTIQEQGFIEKERIEMSDLALSKNA